MIKALILPLLLASLSFSNCTSAENMNYGLGGVSCGKWTEETQSGPSGMLEQWVYGFVSSADLYAELSKQPYKIRDTDPAAISAWINNYCASHPLDNVYVAATSLVGKLMEPRLPE